MYTGTYRLQYGMCEKWSNKGIFDYREDSKNIKDIRTQKTANEHSIFLYYNRKSEKSYKPISKSTFYRYMNNEVKSATEKLHTKTSRKVFNNGSLIDFFSKADQKRYLDYDLMYISTKVRVYFDGVFVDAVGRGDYYYKDKPDYISERLKRLPNHIRKEDIETEIRKAVKRALAPFGYEVRFKLISWKFCYYKERWTGERYL